MDNNIVCFSSCQEDQERFEIDLKNTILNKFTKYGKFTKYLIDTINNIKKEKLLTYKDMLLYTNKKINDTKQIAQLTCNQFINDGSNGKNDKTKDINDDFSDKINLKFFTK
jgi:hypothetical protein